MAIDNHSVSSNKDNYKENNSFHDFFGIDPSEPVVDSNPDQIIIPNVQAPCLPASNSLSSNNTGGNAPPVLNAASLNLPSVDIESHLTSNYEFRINEITNKVEFKLLSSYQDFVPMGDYEYNSLLRDLKKSGIKCSIQQLRQILYSSFSTRYNPMKDYLKNLPAWDPSKPDYIQWLADTIQAEDQPFWSKIFKKWFVAMVGSAWDDKIVNHCILILKGGQGIGKTSWLNNLIPTELKSYIHCGPINPDSKDDILQLSECLLINMDELGGLSKHKLNSLKEFITKAHIRLRRAYGYNHQNYVRRASFCGSTNESQILTDSTGNRRFLCISTLKIDYRPFTFLEEAYSQAMYLISTGFKHFFDEAEIKEINDKNEQFSLISKEEEYLISNYKADSTPHEWLTSTELALKLGKMYPISTSQGTLTKLGIALGKHHFIRKKKKGLWKWGVTPI